MKRIIDAATANYAANHPDVLKALAPGYGEVDMTDFVKDRRNVCLKYGVAVAIFEHKEPGVFEGHYLFPPAVRGKAALKAARKMFSEMFTTYGANAIHGHVPRLHRAARVTTRALGLTPVGESRDASGRECVHYLMKRDEWEALSAA